MLLRTGLFLMFLVSGFSGETFTKSRVKNGVVYFEMANYFFQGKDFKNAKDYYLKADGILSGVDELKELKVVLCRNLATIHQINEEKQKSLKTLSKCMNELSVKDLVGSKVLREIYKMYATIQADMINPKILDMKRQQMHQKMQYMRKQNKKKKGPKLGFK
ncbi:MAG: hypothetical protein COB02_02200 [Candidatus Cloacimonadota bacterium]|nr:MAG: hypothetical protein COB02_02200 [Candidatus Cloacimonadota bacterium]